MNMKSQTMMTKATRILTLALLMFASVASAATSLTSISGLSVWLDGSDASTLFKDAAGTTQVSANGDQVALWRDKSGNNNNAVAWVGSTPSVPTYTTSALGGKSALTFNGSRGLNNLTYAWSSSVNIFAVVSANSWSSANGYTYVLTSAEPNYAGIALTGGAHDGWNANEVLAFGNNWPSPASPRVNAPFGTSLIDGQAAILDVSLSSTVADIALNGSLLTPTYQSLGAGLSSRTGFNVAGNALGEQAWQGNIAELVIFDRVLSDSEANEVGSYLQDKYGITGAYAIPEPSSLGLLLLGGGAVLLLRRRR